MNTLAAVVAPVEDFQPALVPDREHPFAVGGVELRLTLAAPVVDAPLQAVPCDQLQREITQRQGNSGQPSLEDPHFSRKTYRSERAPAGR